MVGFYPIFELYHDVRIFQSDTPLALMIAALQSIPELTGTTLTGFSWSLFTGDLVSHDRKCSCMLPCTLYEQRY